MSFDERQHMDDNEIYLTELFRSVWFYKFSLLAFIILSFPISIIFSSYLEPTFKAETVFEKPSEPSRQDNSLMRDVQRSGLMTLLGDRSIHRNDSFFSEVRSESFLKTVILNNAEIDSKMLEKFCSLPSKETSRFSLRSLLISLGISENRVPSASQKTSLLVRCVNEMLEIDFDTYKRSSSGKSSAYRLSIETGDPNFSANLANQIVKKYFARHEKKRDQDFKKLKEYLSEVITEAQLEFTEANKLMQSFIIKNTLLMNMKPSIFIENDIRISNAQSPFASKLNDDVFSLSQLEKSLSKLNLARLKLFNFKEIDQEETYKEVLATDIQEVLSGTFISSISNIDNSAVGAGIKNQDIKKLLSQELQSLEQQIQALKISINNKEEQTRQLMNIENRYQELAIDVSKKKFIFQGLKDQLKEQIFTAGLANIEQPVLLTEAVPPFSKAFPNKIMIVSLGVLLSIFAGIAYILISHLSNRKVHSLSQIQKTSRFLSCYAIKYKHLKTISVGSVATLIGQSFFLNAKGTGKLGCIIDLSQKGQNNSLASKFSKTIVSLLATDNSKIVCLDPSLGNEPFTASAQNKFVSGHKDTNVQGILSNSTLTFNDEAGMIAAGEITKIKNKYSDYDKIICTLGAEIGDLTKFKFIEKCDFYILIGRSFHFDEYTYKKFSNTVWEKEKKCLGFFLIN